MPIYINGATVSGETQIANGVTQEQLQDAIESMHYLDAHADEAVLPATGRRGDFLLNEATNSLWVWDPEPAVWVDSGVAEGQAGNGVQFDTSLDHVYDAITGAGFGFEQAREGRFELTPAGDLQCIDGSYHANQGGGASWVKFGRIVQPGDTVTIPSMGSSLTAPSNQRRFLIAGVTAGEDPNFKSDQGTWAHSQFAGYSHRGNQSDIHEFGMSWIGGYWSPHSYGPGLVHQGALANKQPANIFDFSMTYRVRDDYRIEVLMDGEVIALTTFVPVAGTDLWYVTAPTNIIAQPVGNVTTTPADTAPPAGSSTPAFMSTTDPGVATVAEGGGYYLYEASTAVTEGDTPLSPEEAAAASSLRMFQDFSAMSVSEVASAMAPIAEKDRVVLDLVRDKAIGWFHAQDLTPGEIQSLMATFGPALQAASAGSVEITLASLQALPSFGTGNSIQRTIQAEGGFQVNGDGYVYQNQYGHALNTVHGITYIYFRDFTNDNQGDNLRIQFQTEQQRDAFMNSIDFISAAWSTQLVPSNSFPGFWDIGPETFQIQLLSPPVVNGTPSNLLLDYHFQDADNVVAHLLNGGSLDLTIAETVSNDNDALVQELISELTTHLLKFPR